MPLTYEKFAQMMRKGARANRLQTHWPYVIPALEKAAINTPTRMAMFFALVAHESDEFTMLEEPGPGHQHEGSAELGNTQPGDGARYKGRGPIGITGRVQYRACGEAMGLDLLANPTLLLQPSHAMASACWFWTSRNLSHRADTFNIRECSRVLNGTGHASLAGYWETYRRLLTV